MTSLKEQVYVLTTVPYRDSDLIVNFLSEQSGRLTTVVYGGRKIGKSNSFLFHSGDLVEIEYSKPENRDFIKLQNTNSIQLQKVDSFSYNRFLFHSYLIEIITKITKPELPAHEPFDLLKNYVESGWSQENAFAFISWAIWMTIRAGGYQIDFSQCSECERASWKYGKDQQPSFRKETYFLNKETGKLICSRCQKQPTDAFSVLTPPMIKVLWFFESSRFYSEIFDHFPKNLVTQLAQLLNGYLLLCFEIKPKALEAFNALFQQQVL